MSVEVVLPGFLADLAGGSKHVVDVDPEERPWPTCSTSSPSGIRCWIGGSATRRARCGGS